MERVRGRAPVGAPPARACPQGIPVQMDGAAERQQRSRAVVRRGANDGTFGHRDRTLF